MSRFENRRRHYLNFEYKPACPPEALKTAVDWLNKLKPLSGPSVDTPAYACSVLVTGKIERDIRGSACHAQLQDGPRGTRACVAFPFSTREVTKKFEEYVRYDSFVSAYILAETKNGVVVSADIPAILLQNIAIILRHFIELDDDHFETFNELLEKGVPADVAYPVSFCRAKNSGMDWRAGGAWGHRAWHSIFSIDAMKNFISGKFFFQGDRLELFRTHSGMYGGRNLCINPSPRYNRESHTPFFKELFTRKDFVEGLRAFRQGPKEVKYTPPNPFKRNLTSGNTSLGMNDVTYKELYEYVIPYALKEGVFNVEENK